MTTSRPIMTRAELREHHVRSQGRAHLLSSDGWDDREIARRRGWDSVPAWGRDGWNLGDWPYVGVYTREVDGKFELQQIVEGDHELYSFGSEDDRNAAIDYLFLWYAAGREWAPLTWEDRERLDAGELTVDEKWRGPYHSGLADPGAETGR